MLDTYNSHPSVLFWSVANESHLNEAFLISNRLVKELDPSRLTTFNHPFSKGEFEVQFDLANRHYPTWPYETVAPEVRQPLVFGEYNFPVCHEQVDVMTDPGLRELWGHGHSDPASAYAQECAAGSALPPLKPGTPPGAWTAIHNSGRLAGGMIWASHDDSFYFPDGTHAGYSWVHGFWGLIDAWRRPKPEWWLAKLIYAPVWFPKRQLDVRPGAAVRLPVENRYSFTDLRELRFTWERGGETGIVEAALPPRSAGEITFPELTGARPGQTLVVRCWDAAGRLVNAAAFRLGEPVAVLVPRPQAGAPDWQDDGRRVIIRGKGFGLVFDRRTGDLDPEAREHTAVILQFPALHLTRYDFGDLAGPNAEPYEVLPKAASRGVDQVDILERPEGLAITVRDHYDDFAGSVTWLIARDGLTTVRTDYGYSGHGTNLREVGMRTRLALPCDELRWRRWSEWGVFPDDSISRTEGTARAWRPGATGPDPEGVAPNWPWSQDQTALGTADFRSIKFNVYEAALVEPDGRGVKALANADAHVRASLDQAAVMMHLLSRCRLAQIPLQAGDRIRDEFTVQLLSGR
jgi:nitrite reductase/ring-hydroxylating ferredoxin subunit